MFKLLHNLTICLLFSILLLFPLSSFSHPTTIRCLLPIFSAIVGNPGSEGEENASTLPVVLISSDFYVSYRGRFLSGGAGEDQVLQQYLGLKVTTPRWSHFSLVLQGDMIEDLDGYERADERDRTSTFFSTWHSDNHGLLYQAFAELSGFKYVRSFRLGRQYANGLFRSRYDGLSFSLDLVPGRLNFYGHGGNTVRFFDESDYGASLEAAAGFDIRLMQNLSFQAEFFSFEEDEETNALYAVEYSERVDQLAAALTYTFHSSGRVALETSFLDSELRSAEANLLLIFLNRNFDVQLSYYHQPLRIEKLPSALSPFSGLLGPVEPFHEFSLNLYKTSASEVFAFTLGFDWRDLLSDGVEGVFNHSYSHAQASFSIHDFFVNSLAVTIHADLWQNDSAEIDDQIVTGGGELNYDGVSFFTIGLGGYYTLFKYDYYLDLDEKTDVYTLFADTQIFPKSALTYRIRYELDMYDINEHTIKVTAGYHF